MGLYSWLMAQCYEVAMQRTEQLCLQQWRRELLQNATGEILEIGAGTGSNLPFYANGAQPILSEPDRQMRKRLKSKIAATATLQPRVHAWSAEQLELPDNSLDTVVSTLVLCSVQDQQQTLTEISRVLRPGGQLLFIEHVRSENETIARRQKLLEPFWRCACGNCHLTRQTLQSIEECGMVIENVAEDNMLPAPSFVSRTLRGCARKL